MAKLVRLVTGANGFVGRAVCTDLILRGYGVRRVVRKTSSGSSKAELNLGDIGPATDWSSSLEGVEAVIHLAARVHVMHDTTTDPLAEFRKVNVFGAERLAREAARAGVRHGDNGLLVPVRNSIALANALQQLIGNSELRRRMGVRGRQIAELEFRVEKVVEETLSIYRQLLQ